MDVREDALAVERERYWVSGAMEPSAVENHMALVAT